MQIIKNSYLFHKFYQNKAFKIVFLLGQSDWVVNGSIREIMEV